VKKISPPLGFELQTVQSDTYKHGIKENVNIHNLYLTPNDEKITMVEVHRRTEKHSGKHKHKI
jgi:hypothetical protein